MEDNTTKEESSKRLRLTLDPHIERKVFLINEDSKENYLPELTPSEKLRDKLQQIDLTKLVGSEEEKNLSFHTQEVELKHNTLAEIHGVQIEVLFLSQILGMLSKDSDDPSRDKETKLFFSEVVPKPSEEKQLKELKLRQMIKRKGFENASKKLLEAAGELDRIIELSQAVEEAAMDIRSRWPLSGGKTNLFVNYSYRFGWVHLIGKSVKLGSSMTPG